MSESVDIASILPRPDGRALAVGKSGCGKSTLMRRILREVVAQGQRLLYIDPKRECNPKGFTLITRPEELHWEHRYPILFQPHALKAFNPMHYEPLYKEVWQRKRMTVYTDEVLFFGTKGTPYMNACLVQGRSNGICVVNGSQMPKNIPIAARTEINTIYAFYLADEDHIRTIRQEMPEYDPRALDRELFEFWYSDGGRARKLRYEPGT